MAWVAVPNLHLTLKFLGDVAEERLSVVAGAIRGAVEGIAPFDLEVGRLGAFPTPSRPRVLWAGLTAGAGPAAELAGRVDQAVAALGFEPETRPFSGHVTLGRVRAPRRNPALERALGAGTGPLGRLRVERVSLMQSQLSPRGARYTELAASVLAGCGSTPSRGV